MKTQIVIFPRGSLTSLDKTNLRRSGYCAVEADDPSKVVLALPGGAVTGDMLTLCALNAMAGPSSSAERSKFTAELTARLNLATAPTTATKD
jgi:hypothetical protein